jgi:hypothetical protein
MAIAGVGTVGIIDGGGAAGEPIEKGWIRWAVRLYVDVISEPLVR